MKKSNTDGITVIDSGKMEIFDWEIIVQFATLAIVFVRENQAVWTISLKESFVVHSEAGLPQSGEISLYEAKRKTIRK
ncbi:hypothetical protein ACQKKK_15800 [Peribacillus sp. NPDC006672]|uniref:hypothetical protein n=1 Tax=Peribacillus sp. NPDC006672 TaxID=3390606 RepID=UPI003D060BD4